MTIDEMIDEGAFEGIYHRWCFIEPRGAGVTIELRFKDQSVRKAVIGPDKLMRCIGPEWWPLKEMLQEVLA